jgi:hypothetical protein
MGSAFDLNGLQKKLYNELLEIVVSIKDDHYGHGDDIDIGALLDDIEECVEGCE